MQHSVVDPVAKEQPHQQPRRKAPQVCQYCWIQAASPASFLVSASAAVHATPAMPHREQHLLTHSHTTTHGFCEHLPVTVSPLQCQNRLKCGSHLADVGFPASYDAAVGCERGRCCWCSTALAVALWFQLHLARGYCVLLWSNLSAMVGSSALYNILDCRIIVCLGQQSKPHLNRVCNAMPTLVGCHCHL